MAKNDTVLLDGILDDRVSMKLPSDRRDEVFEYLAIEQILKDADLSQEEIQAGSVDGRNDGGIDGFFIFVNGHLFLTPETFIWPRSGCELEVWIITCKHHDTFIQAPLDNLAASLSELLDLSLTESELAGDYSEEVLKCRECLKIAYRRLSPRLNKFTINFSYVSRGDTTNIGESVCSRSKQIVRIAEESFGSCNATFTFNGSTELVGLYRTIPSFSIELPFLECLAKGERYVLLTQLDEFYNFITDQNGKLRRYLFDSNVRDFMGLNRVNEDIKATLEDIDSPDFWWLNNGITILATSASVIGKSIKLEDIQIVNGLQTTESIFRFFESGGKDPLKRSVLIKVIVSSDDDVRDTIIRATNNQTDVELASLHATDKIQRDIEDILERHGLYYERRKNHYANFGHPPSLLISPLYLASGYLSLILKLPNKASKLKSKFMRSDFSYNKVFSEITTLKVWPVIAKILKKTDEVLEMNRPTGSSAGQRFLKRWRHPLSLITISTIFGKYDFNAIELAGLDLQLLTENKINITWDYINEHFPHLTVPHRKRKESSVIMDLYKSAGERFGITGIDCLHRRSLEDGRYMQISIPVDMKFALKVNEILPDQPWKPGVNKYVADKLGCSNKAVYFAIQMLIQEGLRCSQEDGVVYDSTGKPIAYDPARVTPETLELINEKMTEKEPDMTNE